MSYLRWLRLVNKNPVTEIALKKEMAKLEKHLGQALAQLKEIRDEVKDTSKNTTRIGLLQEQMIEEQRKAAVSLKAQKKEKAPKKKRKLTEMNIFVKQQIQGGKSFIEAIRAWKEYKASKLSGASTGLGPAPTESSSI
jgi:prephenate dehydratase